MQYIYIFSIFKNPEKSHAFVITVFKNKRQFLVLFVLLAVVAAYFFFNPANSSYFLKCPFQSFTGLNCPGCGSQRALHQLLHLNFKKAFEYNALFTVAVPYFLLTTAFNFTGLKQTYPKVADILYSKTAAVLWIILALLYFVYRNF